LDGVLAHGAEPGEAVGEEGFVEVQEIGLPLDGSGGDVVIIESKRYARVIIIMLLPFEDVIVR